MSIRYSQRNTIIGEYARITRSWSRGVAQLLLAAGIIAGPLFIGMSLIQALTRQGFDLKHHAISSSPSEISVGVRTPSAGKLAFLNNLVGVFESEIDAEGNVTEKVWEWK